MSRRSPAGGDDGRSARICRAALGRLPGRPAPILRREQSAWTARAVRVAGQAGEDGLTVGMVDRALSHGSATEVVDGCFLAGRCETDVGEDLEHFAKELREVLGKRPVERLGGQAAAYVEAAMSVAMITGAEAGKQLLAPLAAGDGSVSTRGYLAAAYLAQLGDASGFPAMVAALRSDTTQTRLMAARNLISFAPYDGEQTGGLNIDLRSQYVPLLDDPDVFVSREVPGLMAEAGVSDLAALLEGVVASDRCPEVRAEAERILQATA